MGQCCCKRSTEQEVTPSDSTDAGGSIGAKPEATFDVVENPIRPATPRPAALTRRHDEASQTSEAVEAAKPTPCKPRRKRRPPAIDLEPTPTLVLPDVPTTPPRKMVTPASPWEMTDGV